MGRSRRTLWQESQLLSPSNQFLRRAPSARSFQQSAWSGCCSWIAKRTLQGAPLGEAVGLESAGPSKHYMDGGTANNQPGLKVGAEQILCSNNARHTQQDPGSSSLIAARRFSRSRRIKGPVRPGLDQRAIQRVGRAYSHVSSGLLVLSGQASRASRSLADAGAAGVPPLALRVCLVLPALRNGSWCALRPVLLASSAC